MRSLITTKDSKKWDEVHTRVSTENLSHSKFAESIEKQFPKNCTVCDLGGGLGLDSEYFIYRGHSVVLLDISEFALNYAKRRIKRIKLSDNLLVKQVDFGLEGIPVRDNSIDVAYSRIGLNYFPLLETADLVKDIYRTLKKGGVAYLAFKSSDDIDEMSFLHTNANEIEPGVFVENEQIRSRFNNQQLETILKLANIENGKVEDFIEEMGSLRDENGVVYDKKLFLKVLTFKKN